MTEAQLDNMLGLCEIGIEKAYGNKPEWCSLEATRMRVSTTRRLTSMTVIFAFAGDPKTYSFRGPSLSEVLGQMSLASEFFRRGIEETTRSRRVIVQSKREVVL